ncbi:epigen isoform X1 [Etheostoma spectabile]|uniref:epigen isoform X1 n=1 Tax=Etheostoma spectabile TaxID=54343 RepID=UPI0013AEF26B|nr:epigen-like isoform X1 [Etheostoma spectabile]
MVTQSQKYLGNALLTAVAALLLLTAAGQSAILPHELQTTAPPALLNSSLLTQRNISSMGKPRVLGLHRPCRSEDETYCENGGECMYPQDSDKPSCTCTSSYSGPRCLFFNDRTHTLPELEQLIAIIFGVAMLIIVLAVIIFCLACNRCIKSAPPVKAAPFV